MQFLNALPLGDNTGNTMYLLLGVAVVCVIAIGALVFIPKRSKNEEPEEDHVEEISEE